jgi:hypothetical protein
MFNENDKVNLCVSKYDTSIRYKHELDLSVGELCCINPLNDTRKDCHVSHFRNFLVEVDDLSLPQQIEYIKALKMPYSCCVYSGNKSMHYGIFLDENLPNEQIYRYLSQWLLNIVTKADQNCKNPSRMIRFPDNVRQDTGRLQKLLELKEKVSLPELYNWLNKYPLAKPIVETKREVVVPEGQKLDIPAWVKKKLVEGMDAHKSRNSQWFGLGCEFAKAGYSELETIEILWHYYQEEATFGQKEWEVAVRQGFKQNGRQGSVSFR